MEKRSYKFDNIILARIRKDLISLGQFRYIMFK